MNDNLKGRYNELATWEAAVDRPSRDKELQLGKVYLHDNLSRQFDDRLTKIENMLKEQGAAIVLLKAAVNNHEHKRMYVEQHTGNNRAERRRNARYKDI